MGNVGLRGRTHRRALLAQQPSAAPKRSEFGTGPRRDGARIRHRSVGADRRLLGLGRASPERGTSASIGTGLSCCYLSEVARILPPLLTETYRYDRFSRNSSMKSAPASPCQREGRQFESGLVLHRKRSPAKRFCLAGLFRLHVPHNTVPHNFPHYSRVIGGGGGTYTKGDGEP